MHSQKRYQPTHSRPDNYAHKNKAKPAHKKYVEKHAPENHDRRNDHDEEPEQRAQLPNHNRKGQKQAKQADYYQTKELKEVKETIKVSSIPKHILYSSTLVDEDGLGLRVETRYIRKYFLEKFFDASKEEVSIRKATYFPCIFLEYWNEDRKIANVDMKDLVRSNRKKFQQKPELISVLFNQLYQRVEPKFFKLAIFGIKVAKDRNISMSKNSVFKQENLQTELMFYYCLSKYKEINFTLIDRHLNFVYFRTEDILKLSQTFQEQYDLFVRFESLVTKSKMTVLGDRWDILENEEIQFNERDIKYVGESIDELEKKLEAELRRLRQILEECEQELKDKENLLKQMTDEKDAESWEKIEQIDSQIEVLSDNIRRAERIVKEISYEKQKLSLKNELTQWFYIKSCKKVILTEKELTSKLPILLRKKEILKMLTTTGNKPLIIEGETGSGKSTQLPQLLLEFCSILEDPLSKPILVTQPRRLATRTLAERVAIQLGEQRPNNFVDYKNSIEKQVNPNAKIIFKLDRLVLDEITEDPLLQKYSCLIIDQAHQRTISIDVIIGLIRGLLDKRSDFKVIITSASMDVELFEREFQTKALKVSGRLFDVKVEYRDYELESTLSKIEKVINQEILHDQNSLKERFKGHVLVFCSGVDQINKLTETYTKQLNPSRFLVFPLHGKIVPEEQRKAFLPCKQHKIIFASRIAETAITIDDVRVVVDPGEDIELIYDQRYKFSSMKIRPISQSSAKQRAGRAGRTAPGHCFRLYSEKQFYLRPLGKVPEMENSSLDTVVLRLKSLGIEDVIEFSYISKPDKEGLLSSIENLKMIGALAVNQSITQMGQLLILIPVEPMLSRSILEALLVEYLVSSDEQKYEYLFGSGDDVENRSIGESLIQILCMIVSSSSLFHINEGNQNEGDLKKFQKFKVNQGDFFFLSSIYHQFKQNLDLVGDKAELSFWIKEFYLSKKALKQVKELESEIIKIITSIARSNKFKLNQLEDEIDEVKEKLRHCHSLNDVLMACLITSFVPNLCIYSEDPQIGYTLISQERPIAIYGTSTLSLVGLTKQSPKWILAYDFYTSEKGIFYCKIAQGIDFNFLKNTVSSYVWKKFNLGAIQKINPFYEKIWQSTLPTKVYSVIKHHYIKFACGGEEDMPQKELFRKSTWIFNDEANFLKIFIRKDESLKDISYLKHEYFSFFQRVKVRYLNQDYHYPYFANVQVVFTDSFEVKSIERVIQKDILISEYCEQDYGQIKQFVKVHLGQLASIEIYPYSRSIKISLNEESYLKVVEQQIQNFLSNSALRQRPIIRVIPRNQRRSSQSKVLLIFYVPNKHQQFDSHSEKFFKMLKNYCEEEENNFQRSHKNDLEWKEEISILLKRVGVNPQNCAINVWGNYETPAKKSEFIELWAEISSFESGIYEKLIEFEGKKRYLGCDKLFIKKSFQQILAFPSERIFSCLKQEFISIVIDEKKKCKDFSVLEKSVRMRNRNFTKIIGKSTNRQALVRAAQRIHYLFQPKTVELKNEQIRFLIDIDCYNILRSLQYEYKYTIAFELNKSTKSLSLFCHSIYFQEISTKLKELIKKSQYLTKSFSYKGKNLNEVVEVVQRLKAKVEKGKKEKLDYQIIFTKKEISVTTIPSIFYELQGQINLLSNMAVLDCELCSGKVRSPYILLKCQHIFCKICLSLFIKNELAVKDHGKISCPKGDCHAKISIYDIFLLIGEHLFEKAADERVRKEVESTQEFQLCPKCYLILDQDENQSAIRCNTCGFFRCLKCNRNHKGEDSVCLSQNDE